MGLVALTLNWSPCQQHFPRRKSELPETSWVGCVCVAWEHSHGLRTIP